MEWTRLLLDFVGKIAWPLAVVITVLILREPVRQILEELAERFRRDLRSATMPGGISLQFGEPNPAIDAKVVEAAKTSGEQVVPPVEREEWSRTIQEAVVDAYTLALAAAFREWYRAEAFEEGEIEGRPDQALLDWLKGPGKALVTKFEIFERLVAHLQGMGMTVSNTPTLEQFGKATAFNARFEAMRQWGRRQERKRQREAVAWAKEHFARLKTDG